MRWIDIAPLPDSDPARMAAVARLALARAPGDATLRATLAASLFALGEYAGALALYEQARDADRASFTQWQRLARCYLKGGRPADALRAAEQGLALGGETAVLRLREGRALQALGRDDAARDALERCLALGDSGYGGLKALLRPLARHADGSALLAYCDALPPPLADNALVRANRAIALSRLGQTEAARALVDLDRDIVQAALPVPAGFADITAFNAALASEALALRSTPSQRDIVYRPALSERPALAALLPLIRAAIDRYLARAVLLGASPAHPSPPAVATLFYGATVLRGDGSNGEHIHEHGRVSAVYHVAVPDSVVAADDDRGALLIGDCRHYSGGHEACWGTRRLAPRPGMLTLFPSHYFHDVIPSRTDEARISIAADLVPVEH